MARRMRLERCWGWRNLAAKVACIFAATDTLMACRNKSATHKSRKASRKQAISLIVVCGKFIATSHTFWLKFAI